MTNVRKLIKPSELKLARVMFALKNISDKGVIDYQKLAEEYKAQNAMEGVEDPHQALLQLALVNHKSIKIIRYLLTSLAELIRAEEQDEGK